MNRSILNKWIILLGLFTLTVLLACQQAPTPTPAFSMSVEQFISDFLADKEAAYDRYRSKYIELTGEVLFVHKIPRERLIDFRPSDNGGSIEEIEKYYTTRIVLVGLAGYDVQCDLSRRDSEMAFDSIEEGKVITVQVRDPVFHHTQGGRIGFISVSICRL